jgi:hypothetical protein
MKVVKLIFPASSTPFLENGKLEKQQKFKLHMFVTRQLGVVISELGITTNFETMPTCEKSGGVGAFCA